MTRKKASTPPPALQEVIAAPEISIENLPPSDIAPHASPSATILMDFPQAMTCVKLGQMITKLEWANPDIYGGLIGGQLRIKLADGKIYNWIISEGDLLGFDWKVAKI